jgi:hypothetical protein
MSARIPVYRYEITMGDGTKRTADAISYREQDQWLIFDDTRTSVLTLRADKVDEIARGVVVNEQLVDEITDPEPEN